jgi:hypothetical protein
MAAMSSFGNEAVLSRGCLLTDPEVGEGRIEIGMATIARKPIFCVVLSDSQQWTVEAEWPDGTIEQIDTFKRHFEAIDWVRNQSEVWLQGRK